MNGPYWLVLINIISSLLLILGILIYRFIFPKKKINPFVLLIIISILPILSIFRAGMYKSGDLSFHVTEEMVFFRSLSEGTLFPIWGGNMNGTYGYPLFMFFYPLPFYFMSFIHLFGLSFINSAKLFLALAYLFSGIFMYLWLKKVVNKTASFVGALFYLFAPYHLIDLHFRVDIGEVLAFVFIPLNLYAATNVIETKKARWFFLEALSIGSLLLSHPAISFESIPALFLYTLCLIKNPFQNKKQLFTQIAAFFTGFFLIAFYWVPLFYDLRYTYLNMTPNISFTTLPELLYSPWRLGLLFQGPSGQLSFLVGCALL